MNNPFCSKYYELAIVLVGLNPEEEDDFADEDKVVALLKEHFGLSFEQFEKMLDTLMPYISVAKSPLTQIAYKGFAEGGKWLCKMPLIDQEYPGEPGSNQG